MPIQTTNERSPAALNLASYLYQNSIMKQRTGLLNNERDIEFFRYKRLSRALLSDDYKSKQQNVKNGLIPINNETDVQRVLVLLIQNQLILPVEKLHYAEIKAIKGWKPNRTKPTLKRMDKAHVDPDAYFAWIYTKPNPYILLYSILAVAGIFAVILFPLWPSFMKRGVWYLSMAALGLIGLFFATAIVRLIIYIISLVAFPKPFWLFPNLFEDCGVLESFQPLYGWEEPKKKKSKKKNGNEPVAEVKANGSAANGSVATGAKAGETSTQKRRVTLEEVDE
ncbi:subunit of ER protein- translocation complex [Scheffersomyces stipitis CBS 6054]|uniref:Translocation protein SEC62 n=1 Tax=Scheffersomyces stipitis (strain ATCC 58785 / CBS 6054 / NBRC 10063 / NRRL Y-11545) TaxID=322104 RepID=A3LXK7_PICST|nr:subunit of ER protein- translocation complex [Scheffersomyces stipitis CBS 6054]ABN67822.1 subunit of ER protein- translocation complex [Scheffersomyces stipitis CBS 6054]